MKRINDKKITIRPKNEMKRVLSDDEIGVMTQYVSAIAVGGDIKTLHDRVYNEILPKFVGSRTITEEGKTAQVVKISYLFGLDTQAPLLESVGGRYASLATEFSKGLFEEYKCNTPSEKALAQTAANAYTRVLEYSNTLESCRNKEVNLRLIGYYSIISKELDRANRQFIMAITTLKQMKAPAINFNVKARNAFVAQNQQFNVNQNNDENIEPK